MWTWTWTSRHKTPENFFNTLMRFISNSYAHFPFDTMVYTNSYKRLNSIVRFNTKVNSMFNLEIVQIGWWIKGNKTEMHE